MNAKLSNFSELSNILSVKSSLRTNLMALFTRFGLGHLLCKLSLEKEAGIPAVQLILSLCLFRIASESIHSMYKKSYYDLLSTGKNCYYRMMTRASMDWRKLLLGMSLRFLAYHPQRACRSLHWNGELYPGRYHLGKDRFQHGTNQ